MEKNEIILYETADHAIKLNVNTDGDTVWLNRAQLAELFDRDVKTIGKHINNALKEELDGTRQLSQNLRQFKLRVNVRSQEILNTTTST